MEHVFDSFARVLKDGLLPCLRMYVDFLTGDGLFLGAGIILLPVLGRIVSIFRKFF